MKIGILDSGIGGLTVLEKLIRAGYSQSYIYLADNKNAPYGNKEKEMIKVLVYDGIKTLIARGADVIILACNTATSVAFHGIESCFSLPVFGIAPPLGKGEKPRALFATSATVAQFENRACGWDMIPLSLLATLVDIDYRSAEIPRYLEKELPTVDYKTAVLGCTHFPFVKDYFSRTYPNALLTDGCETLLSNLSAFFDKIKGNPLVEIEFVFSGEDRTEYFFSALRFLLEKD